MYIIISLTNGCRAIIAIVLFTIVIPGVGCAFICYCKNRKKCKIGCCSSVTTNGNRPSSRTSTELQRSPCTMTQALRTAAVSSPSNKDVADSVKTEAYNEQPINNDGNNTHATQPPPLYYNTEAPPPYSYH